MGSVSDRDHPLRIFLFDTPRTNSQVFYKLFSQHPELGWGRSYHDYVGAALYGPERVQQRLRHGEAAEKANQYWGTSFPDTNSDTYDMATSKLTRSVEETEKDVSCPM